MYSAAMIISKITRIGGRLPFIYSDSRLPSIFIYLIYWHSL